MRGDDEIAFLESSIYYEQPIHERVSLVATPWVEQGADVGDDGWRAEAGVGLKAAILRDERSAVAVQGGVVWNSWPNFGCAETGAELRLLAGRSLGSSGFVNAEYGRRVFEGDCGGERIDLTVGYRPGDGFLVMGQVFYDAALRSDETVKAQISLVRFGHEGRGVQIGLRARIDEGLTEPALVVAFWGRPGD
jgi:hypothetical protein